MSRSNAHFNVMFSCEVYVTNVADAASPVFKKKNPRMHPFFIN